jgi:DNA helicase-2/ATP-dependent DNA helicase PcrA
LAGFRARQILPGVGPAAAGRMLDALELSSEPHFTLAAVDPPPRSGAVWSTLVATLTGRIGWREAIAKPPQRA